MGVGWPDISFLLATRQLGASFDRTLTIGHQWLFGDAGNVVHAHEDAGERHDGLTAVQLVDEGGGFADPIFRSLGAHVLDVVDASDYEGGGIVHDFNEPLPEHLRSRYSLVFDGGSLEHIFNFPQALKNCLAAVEPGGHFVTITPANSLLGHGLYQFSPDLYFQALRPEHGFEIVLVLLRFEHRWARWRVVADPSALGRRVTLSDPWPAYMYVMGRRLDDREPLRHWPQQSDYATVWSGGELARPVGVEARFRDRLPTPARRAFEAIRAATALTGRTTEPSDFRSAEMTAIVRDVLQARAGR